jgi:hypothetical protein
MKLFEKSINKPARVDLVPIRISEQLRLEQMDTQFEKYVYQEKLKTYYYCSVFRLCTNGSLDQIDNERLLFTNNDIETKPRVPICGLWIFKFVQRIYFRTLFSLVIDLLDLDPWTILLSKSHQSKYFHNQMNRTSTPSAPVDYSHVASLR